MLPFKKTALNIFLKMAIHYGRHLVSEMEKQTESSNYNSLQQILTLYL